MNFKFKGTTPGGKTVEFGLMDIAETIVSDDLVYVREASCKIPVKGSTVKVLEWAEIKKPSLTNGESQSKTEQNEKTGKMEVFIEMRDGNKVTYKNITRIDDSDKNRIKIYSNKNILAILNKEDVKSLNTKVSYSPPE